MRSELNLNNRISKLFKAYKIFLLILPILLLSCGVVLIVTFREWPEIDKCYYSGECEDTSSEEMQKQNEEQDDGGTGGFSKLHIPVSTGFGFPVGAPDAEGFCDLQGFGVNNHLGEDWNDLGYCNSDLGKSVYSISEGRVSFAENVGGGWGNVVRIIHKIPRENQEVYDYVESLYAHLNEMNVEEGEVVKKGQLIGTIGNVEGKYCAHLHFELRAEPELELGGGYSTNIDYIEGFLNPTEYITHNRRFN